MTAAEAAEAVPVVGEFATVYIGSDRYPVEILRVTAATVTVRPARVVAAGPDAGTAALTGAEPGTFVVVPNEAAEPKTFRRTTRNGRTAYRSPGGGYSTLGFGRVDNYRDPSF